MSLTLNLSLEFILSQILIIIYALLELIYDDLDYNSFSYMNEVQVYIEVQRETEGDMKWREEEGKEEEERTSLFFCGVKSTLGREDKDP